MPQYESHLRVTMSGTLPGGEIFSMGVAMANPVAADDAITQWIGLGPNANVHTDIANDCAAFFSRGTTGILASARLKRVVIAPIGNDGRYSGVAAERLVDVPGGVAIADTAQRTPNAQALAVTLHTEGDLNRVKGRFYLPTPGFYIQDDGRLSQADVNACLSSSETFLEALANQPGYDILNLVPVVASSGRRNKDGSVRLGPNNYRVTAVSVGRVPDVVRRRRNKQLEGPRTLLAIT